MTQNAHDSIQQDLSYLSRMRRLWPYFGKQHGAWALAILATLFAAATEPLIPALFKPLLDEGFTENSLPLWMVPTAVIGIFSSGALRFLCLSMRLRALPMTVCKPCARLCFAD